MILLDEIRGKVNVKERTKRHKGNTHEYIIFLFRDYWVAKDVGRKNIVCRSEIIGKNIIRKQNKIIAAVMVLEVLTLTSPYVMGELAVNTGGQQDDRWAGQFYSQWRKIWVTWVCYCGVYSAKQML